MESQLSEVTNMKMHTVQFVLIVNWIQMKSMKVTDTLRNITSQEFQHCLESGLIEVMKMKKHSSQFMRIVHWIRM
jgi:hypothetical protein